MAERGKSYTGEMPADAASEEGVRRVALVIGNSAYPTAPLRNPKNDAEAFAAKLKVMHPSFDVILSLDADRDAMWDALEKFETKLEMQSVGRSRLPGRAG